RLRLVGEDAGELLGGLGALEEPTKNDDVASRRSHGVDDGAVHDGHSEGVRLRLRLGGELADDGIDAGLTHGILAAAAGWREVLDDGGAETLLPRHGHAGCGEAGEGRGADESDAPANAPGR